MSQIDPNEEKGDIDPPPPDDAAPRRRLRSSSQQEEQPRTKKARRSLRNGVFSLRGVREITEAERELLIRFVAVADKKVCGTPRGLYSEEEENPSEYWRRWEIPLGILNALLEGTLSSSPKFDRLLKDHRRDCEEVIGLVRELVPMVQRAAEEAAGVKSRFIHVSLGVIEPMAKAQRPHPDSTGADALEFYVASVPATEFENQGSTEFGNGKSRSGFETFDGPILWRGNVWHRGGENKSEEHTRLVLFFTFDNSETDLAIEDNLPFVL